MKKSLLAAVVALVALLITTSELAAATPNKARTLILQKSDFPPGTTTKNAAGDASAEGSGYSVTFHYRSAGKPRELSASLIVLKSRSLAVAMFKEYRSDMLPIVPKLKLPRYGDEQAANHSVLGGSQLIVRKGSVIWVLEPQTFFTRGGKTYELSRAEAIAEYKRYASKQQRRVGKG